MFVHLAPEKKNDKIDFRKKKTIEKLIFDQKNPESGKPESGGCRDPGFRYLE